MAATGEVADPTPEQVAPYTERVTRLDQVAVGDLVVVRPPFGEDKIQKVKGKHEDHKGRGPAVDVGTFTVSLSPKKGDIMGAMKLFRVPAEGGKRRRGKSRRSRKSRKSTRRRRA